jgi:peptidyl-prolyl cis-trans isomerase B (cyclophilin B)
MGDEVLGKLGDTATAMGNSGEKSKPTSRVAVEKVQIVPANAVP